MKLRVIATICAKDFQTKTGLPIEIETKLDSEGDKNRGWQVNEYTAKIEGSKVGYIKTSYIPKERFKRYYPSIFYWLDHIKGWSLGLRNEENLDIKSEEFWKKLVIYAGFGWNYVNDSTSDLEKRLLDIRSFLIKSYQTL